MEEENQLNQNVPAKKTNYLLWIIIFLLLIIIVGGVIWYLGKNKDKSESKETVQTSSKDSKPLGDQNKYNWSTMDKGPYHDRISYATGTSITNWTDSEKILTEHASVPEVIVKNGVIHVYFVDVSEDGKPEQIGHMQSSDNGKTWSDKTIIPINGLGDKVAVDPDPYLLPDGRIRLYYFDISKTMTEGLEKNSIYSAISDDGLSFTEEDGVRFKYPAIFDPEVIKVGNLWRMYVGTDDQKVLSATSSDGLTFAYEGVALSGGAIPNVVYENGKYYLFTGGIEISTSSDGKTFTKTSNRFDSGSLTADPGVAKLSDGSYFMIYKTDDGTIKPQNPKP